MNNIIHLTTNHSPFDDRIFYKECSLLRHRYKVLILACARDGKLYDLCGNIKQPGLYDEISIDAFGVSTNNRYIRYVKREFNGYTFEIINKMKESNFKPEIIHCHEASSLKHAVKLKQKIGGKIIYDVHEFSLGYSFDRFKNPLICYLHFAKELWRMKCLFKSIDATISVNDIIRSFNVVLNPYIKHIVVSNGYIFGETDQARPRIDDKIVLVHEGSISFNRGLKFMVDCFDDEWFRVNVCLKIVGELKSQEKTYFENQAKKKPWLLESIVQTGWLDYLNVPKNLSGSIGLILMEPAVNNLLAGPPNKLFNYVSASLPVISFDIPASTRMIDDYNIGLVVKRNFQSFKQGIQKVNSNFQYYKANIEKSRNKFSFFSESEKIYQLYEEILKY